MLSRHTHLLLSFFFFFHAPATTKIYTLSLHDALPISITVVIQVFLTGRLLKWFGVGFTLVAMPFLSMIGFGAMGIAPSRSEEHTSELQSHSDLVCRLLLEKKKKKNKKHASNVKEKHTQ